MRNHFFAAGRVVAALLVSSIGAQAEMLVEYQPGMHLGQAFNSYTGALLEDCYVGQKDATVYNSSRADFTWDEVHTTEQMRRALGVSTSAGYNGGVTRAFGKATYVSSFKSNLSEINIVARMHIETGFDLLRDATLKPDVRKQVTGFFGGINPLKLRQRCGTHFVSSIVYGGELSAVMTEHVNSSKDYDEFKITASASQGAFSGSMEASSEIEESRFAHNLKIKGHLSGGSEEIFTDVPSLRLKFRNLRREVSGNLEQEITGNTKQIAQIPAVVERKTAPIEVVLTEYAMVGAEADKAAALDIAVNKLDKFKDFRDAAASVAETPSRFFVNPESVPFTFAKIDKLISKYVLDLRAQMNRCADAESGTGHECDFSGYPQPPTSPDADLPKLYADECNANWQPPRYGTEFAVMPRVSGDGSMGGNDVITIETTYEGKARQPLIQTTKVVAAETRGDHTTFSLTQKRSFFDPVAVPISCLLSADVSRQAAPGHWPVGGSENDYRSFDFNTPLIGKASCRTNKNREDDGYVGCNWIEFASIQLPLMHFELDQRTPENMLVPDWLAAGGNE
jgi:hypothetical protein